MLHHKADLEVRVRDFACKVTRREEGATAVEYALMVALIAAVIIAAVVILGGVLDTTFTEVGESFASF